MKVSEQLRELEEVAEKKAIRVSYEALGVGTGGLCKVRGEHRVILDKRSSERERVNLLAQILSKFSLDDIFVTEETRRLVELNS